MSLNNIIKDCEIAEKLCGRQNEAISTTFNRMINFYDEFSNFVDFQKNIWYDSF